MALHNDLGKKGEEEAVRLLNSKGHRIVERNWTLFGYEIDIISEHEEFIVFTEVKTRSGMRWGNPEEAIGKSKMKRLIAAADIYLTENKIDKPARFDVVAVVWNGAKFDCEHFEDAFMAFL
jgi:putative endonuclease